jgi:hypothetical protein
MAVVAIAAAIDVAAAASEYCIKDWTTAQAIVKKHKLAKVEQLSAQAVRYGLGAVVRARLCRERNGYVYRVILRDRSGRLKRHVTAAKRPFAARRPNAEKSKGATRR